MHVIKLGGSVKNFDVMGIITGNSQLKLSLIDMVTSAESALRLSLLEKKLEEYYKVFDSLNKKEEYIK